MRTPTHKKILSTYTLHSCAFLHPTKAWLAEHEAAAAYPEAIAQYSHALELGVSLPYKTFELHQKLAELHLRTNAYNLALPHLETAHILASARPQAMQGEILALGTLLITTCQELGDTCYAEGAYPEATRFYLQALAVDLPSDSAMPTTTTASLYHKLSLTHAKHHDYQEAIACMQQAINTQESTVHVSKPVVALAYLYQEAATYHVYRQEYDYAVSYLGQVLGLAPKLPQEKLGIVAQAKVQLADIYQRLARNLEAKEFHQPASRMLQEALQKRDILSLL